MPTWHLYLKWITLTTLGAFAFWVGRDLWFLLLIAAVVLLIIRANPRAGQRR